jgi:CRISPR-associated protein Cmr4
MKSAVLFLNAVSPIHNGAGQGLGFIDRPIIRERITGYPIVQGSSIKGPFRDCSIYKEVAETLFGPLDDGSKHAGCVSFGDAHVLAFPIRSLRGGFVWAASPLVLYRFRETLKFLEGPVQLISKLDALLKGDGTITSGLAETVIAPDAEKDLCVDSKKEYIVLEEYPRRISDDKKMRSNLAEFAKELSRVVFPTADTFLAEAFVSKFVILPEDSFSYFARHATEVAPNIAIDDDKGTTKDGSLRYSEYLPSESILYVLLGFEKPNTTAVGLTDDASVRSSMLDPDKFPKILRIGGDITKGKGIVSLAVLR